MEREVVGYDVHKKMLDKIVQNLLDSLDCSRAHEENKIKLLIKNITIPDLKIVFSDVKRGKYLYFVNYSFITGEPLVTEYNGGLVHVARICKKNYVVFSDWTHSNPIEGNIDRIYVNGEGKLCVQVGGSIITVDAEPGRYGRKKFS